MIHNSDALATRISHALQAEQGVCLVLGTGATMPNVPGAAGLVRLAAEHYGADNGQVEGRSDSLADAYGATIENLKATRGLSAIKKLIQDAVLTAYSGEDREEYLVRLRDPAGLPLDASEATRLTQYADQWSIPAGMRSLADLLGLATQPFRILTTNFDPLLEVACIQAGVELDRVVLASGMRSDANPDIAATDRPQVIHLHGHWSDYTRHIQSELTDDRPAIEDWIFDRIRNDLVVVLGYGGWHDALNKALERAARRQERAVDIGWAFYQSESVPEPGVALRDRLDSIGASLYAPCDVNDFFPQLATGIQQVQRITTIEQIASDEATIDETILKLRRLHGFGFLGSGSAPIDVSTAVFWPLRLRAPHLVHASHTLAAALLARQGVEVHLVLDELPLADDAAGEHTIASFGDAVRSWFEPLAPAERLSVHSIEDLIVAAGREPPDAFWATAARYFDANDRPIADFLAASKVLLDPERPGIFIDAVRSWPARMLQVPPRLWAALNSLLVSESFSIGRVLTLGGVDEQHMWEQWRRAWPSEALQTGHLLAPPLELVAGTAWDLHWLNHAAPFGEELMIRQLVASAGDTHHTSRLLEWFLRVVLLLRACRSESYAASTLDQLRAEVDDGVSDIEQIVGEVGSWFFQA